MPIIFVEKLEGSHYAIMPSACFWDEFLLYSWSTVENIDHEIVVVLVLPCCHIYINLMILIMIMKVIGMMLMPLIII